MGSRTVLVTDTNIWIDLYKGGIALKLFSLPGQLIAPDIIIRELQEPSGGVLVAHGLESHDLPGEGVLEVMGMAAKYPKPSRQDLFALVHLFSGPGKLIRRPKKNSGLKTLDTKRGPYGLMNKRKRVIRPNH